MYFRFIEGLFRRFIFIVFAGLLFGCSGDGNVVVVDDGDGSGSGEDSFQFSAQLLDAEG